MEGMAAVLNLAGLKASGP